METKRRFSELQKYGVDAADSCVDHILEWLRYQQELAPTTLTHSKVGWGEYDGNTIFKHYHAIGCPSTYCGNMCLEPKGKYNDWLECVNNEVIGHAPLELALTLGLSAPLTALVAKETGTEVLLFHICGDSTMGKTTAVRVATSTFGLPSTANGGLIKTWNGTKNAILAHFRGNLGIPIGLDEASIQSGDFTDVIYQIALGRNKDRCQENGELRNTDEWATTVLSTAEYSLQNKTKQNTGTIIRVIEAGNITWTRSSVNAETLKQTFLNNYGHAGPLFVQHLMKKSIDEILSIWRKWCDLFCSKVVHKDAFTSRVAEKHAILLTTAELANKVFPFHLNIQKILDLLLKVDEETGDTRDIGERAYQYFLEAFAENRANFEQDSGDRIARRAWGKYTMKNGEMTEIIILKDAFEKIMSLGGFESPKVVLQNWRKKNLLDCEKGRLDRKRMVDGVEQRPYVIRILKEEHRSATVQP